MVCAWYMDWHMASRQSYAVPSMTTGRFRINCLTCGASLEGLHASRKYCSDACKIRYRRNENHPPPTYVGDFDLLPKHLRENFTMGDPDECWIYAKRAKSGYAMSSSVKTHKAPAYRLLYFLMVGPIPKGHHLDHICDNGSGGCVNWHHLKPAIPKDNLLRSEKNACAVKARQTHCVNGHPFTPENTLIVKRKNGHASRICRICQDERNRRFLAKQGRAETNRKRREYYARNIEQQRAAAARKRERRRQRLREAS